MSRRVTKQQIIEGMRIKIETLEAQNYDLKSKLKLLEQRVNERHEAAVGQTIQSMSNMMEASARVILSLHRNL